MTTQYSPDGKQRTAKRTISGNGLNGILRTRWSIPTCRRKKGRNTILISSNKENKKTNEEHTYPLPLTAEHWICFPAGEAHQSTCPCLCTSVDTAARTSTGDRRENPGRTVKTTSLLCGKCSRCSRKASRMIRFILFRPTALPVFFCTLIPNRLYPFVFSVKIRENPFPCTRFP